jgi:hypothetical protein
LIRSIVTIPLLLGILLLALAMPRSALAQLKLTNLGAEEDSRRVTLRFTFSEPAQPDVTYFYTQNYVGLRFTGLRFTSRQLERSPLPPQSEDAQRAYRSVRFVQDRESGEIRLYLAKPLTPADAQVIPYDTYTEVKLLKPIGAGTPVDTEKPDGVPEFVPGEGARVNEVSADPLPSDQPSVQDQINDAFNEEQLAPSLRVGSPVIASNADPRPADEPVLEEPAAAAPREKTSPEPVVDEPVEQAVTEPAEETPQGEPDKPIGGPSYTDFDLDKVPIKQLSFTGQPFREALAQLVGETGYNVIIADDVDNSEVTLNFNQKQMSLKAALDLLAVAFDLEWEVTDAAILIKAKTP